jgi:hypothetical protein
MMCYYYSSMKLRAFLVLAAAAVLIIVAMGNRPAGTSYRQVIVDVSWPNCNTKPGDVFATGIIGITGGLDFHANRCLATESTWFSHYAVYVNTGYPGNTRARRFIDTPRRCGFSDSSCLAYNYGFNEGLYAVKYADQQNVHSDLWWLDVETENSWATNFLVNRQFLAGAIAAIKQQTWSPAVGIYSASDQWTEIVGPWHNKLPVWLATGATDKATAVKACGNRSFTDGSIWLTQYTIKYDENFSCSSPSVQHFQLQK